MSFAFKTLYSVIATSLIAFSASAQNYDLSGRWGVGGALGVTTTFSPKAYRNNLDEDGAGSLWVRYHLTSRLGFELGYSRLMFKADNYAFGSKPRADVLDFSVAYRAWPTERLHMLVQLGVGYVQAKGLSATVNTNKDYALKARIGAEYMATENFALGLNADYFNMNLGSGSDSRLSTLVPNLAVTYYFGGAAAPVAAAPVAAAVPAMLDGDHDGVADADDKCLGTAAGQKVNEFGCASTEKMEFTLNIQFANGSSKIDEAYVADVQKLADFMTKYPTIKAEIEGHTDNTGSEKMNYSISQKRAAAVRTYLITQSKIDKSRLTAKGFGPSQPVADNATPEGRLKNRRVVAHVKAN